MKLILGSTSPYRKQILENAGFIFETAQPLFDEDQFKLQNPKLSPLRLCESLARGKCESLVGQFSHDFVLGCDQLVELGGEILGKPKTFENAFKQLSKMSGTTHLLHTCMTVSAPALTADGNPRFHTYTTTTKITFRKLSGPQIEKYLKLDEPFDCAGSYKMEKGGLLLVKSLESADPFSIQGLSLLDLGKSFEDFEVLPTQFWKGN